MTFARPAIATAALVAASVTFAQPVTRAPAPAPSAWTVSPDEALGTVEIAATAKDSGVHFVAGCDRSDAPGITGTFSNYRGTALRADGQIEHVAFYVRGEDWQDAFSVRLRYSAADQGWVFAQPLSPVFLSSFSRGATLAVVNSRSQEVFAFDLTGSTAAVRSMRTVCRLAS